MMNASSKYIEFEQLAIERTKFEVLWITGCDMTIQDEYNSIEYAWWNIYMREAMLSRCGEIRDDMSIQLIMSEKQLPPCDWDCSGRFLDGASALELW